MTNFPVPHARDAKQFVAFARAMSGNRILGIVKLVFAVGPVQALRKLRNVVRGSTRPVSQGKTDLQRRESLPSWIRPLPCGTLTAGPDGIRKVDAPSD